KDVDTVVSIGATPTTCDAARPRNFMILTGGREELFSTEECGEAIGHATGGKAIHEDEFSGSFGLGTNRAFMKVNNVNHLTELADPRITRRVVQWVESGLDRDAGKVPGERLLLSLVSAVLATIGGLAGSIALTGWFAERLLGRIAIASQRRALRIQQVSIQ